MKTAIFIPARLCSKRLPGKALLEIKGKPIIAHLIQRIKLAKKPNLIVLCTTSNPSDRPLIDFAEENGISYFEGNETDILVRLLDAATKFDIDTIAEVDGDDVFCDPEYIDKTLAVLAETNADFVTCKELPLGASPNTFSINALRKICQLKNTSNTETGWGQYFTKTDLFKVEYVKVDDADLRHPEIRLTLDYPEDFKFIEAIFDRLYNPDKVFTLRQIMGLLKDNPSLIDINKSVKNKYWENFYKSSIIDVQRR